MLADIMSQGKWPELWPTDDDDAWGQLPCMASDTGLLAARTFLRDLKTPTNIKTRSEQLMQTAKGKKRSKL